MKRSLAIFLGIVMIMPVFILLSAGHQQDDLVPTRGSILHVSDSGSTWSVIQEAIDNATRGDTIRIAPGNYSRGFLLLSDGIDIIGNHTQGEVNIRAPGESAVAGISSDDSTVRGLNLIEDGEHMDVLMVSQCRNLTLSDMSIRSTTSDCVLISDCTNITLKDIEIDSGEREAIQFRDIWQLKMDGFQIDSSESLRAVSFTQDCMDLKISNGSLTVGLPDSVAFHAEDRLDLVLDNVSSIYSHEFLRMENGTVVCYDTFFGAGDINITSTSVEDTLEAFVRKDLKALYEDRNGELVNASGVEINISSDRGGEYITGHFGGMDPATDERGTIGTPVELMFYNTTGGGFPHTTGSASLEAFYPLADFNGTLMIGELDLTDKDPVILEFRDILHKNGTISGRIIYEGGPNDGENASNAMVGLYPGYMEIIPGGILSLADLPIDLFVVWNITTDTNGSFALPDMDLLDNYTLVILPQGWVVWNGTESGYLIKTVHFSHPTDPDGVDYPDSTMELTVPYFESVSPKKGPVYGTVRFGDKGPLAGQVGPNVTVFLYNLTGERIGETTSDGGGSYSFSDIPFGDGYELRAMPPEDVLGINNNRTGYLFWDGSAFDHNGSTRYNISLKYYQFSPPEVNHPKVSVIDMDNDPIEGVKVEARVNGTTYIAFTDEFGVAEFGDFEGITFPDGTSFKAELDGYDPVEWDQGDGIPKMEEEEERSDDILLVWILIGMIVIILVFGTILIMNRKKVTDTEE